MDKEISRIGENTMSEIRFDLVTGKMVIIAVERAKRPHDFAILIRKKREAKIVLFVREMKI
ncbi:MAG: UDPglucose--hexose-phosphate uridylyltransferase [Caldanaerobacter sp.]|nr:UDPglucose--hexose-phosphate uridylyltransferase [Caldanaerobacter sp.]